MIIQKEAPNKKWKIYVQLFNNQVQQVLTGNQSRHKWLSQQYGTLDYYGKPYPLIQEHPNIIFEASFEIVTYGRGRSAVFFTVREAGTDHDYYIGAANMLELLQSLAKGTHIIKDNAFHGLWTFNKQGTEVYLKPHVE